MYLATDYVNALKFYDHRAGTSKRWYRVLSTYLIVVSAGLTPLIACAPKNDVWRIIASVLSATIVIATGLLAQFKCHENWLSHRSSWRWRAPRPPERARMNDLTKRLIERRPALKAIIPVCCSPHW